MAAYRRVHDSHRLVQMKWGVFFCKKGEKLKVFLVQKWTFPQRKVHYVQHQYFLFYILLI